MTPETETPFHRGSALVPSGERLAVEDLPSEDRASGLVVVSNDDFTTGGVVVGVPHHIDSDEVDEYPWLRLGAVVHYRKGAAIEIKGVKFVGWDDIVAWEPALDG